jgi:hypothetical protein
VPDGNSHALSIYEIYVGLESVGSLVREQLLSSFCLRFDILFILKDFVEGEG